MKKSIFGITPMREEINLYTMKNNQGMEVTVTNLGAVIRNIIIPDKRGRRIDVVLGYDLAEQYLRNTNTYFGAIVGRNANRIEGGKFKINGNIYHLPQNEGDNNLHSGPLGYQLRIWETESINEEENQITLLLHSPDGDQGYPGNLVLRVTYRLNESNEVSISYEGISDANTILNPTNHSYFNLGGHDSGTILSHKLTIFASEFTPVKDFKSIPTGEFEAVKGTPMDFCEGKLIGKDIEQDFTQLHYTGGYDHNYVLNKEKNKMYRAAEIQCRESGISMDVETDMPGIQFYSGNFLDNEIGKNGAVYHKRSGFCLETQYFPNAVNIKRFASPVLEAGVIFNSQTVYRFKTTS